MVELKNVSVTYASGVDALSDVTLKINDGDFAFVVGSSGAGKSTMIKLLLKEIDATSGSVIVNGYNLNKLRKKKIPKFRRTLGFVFQDFRLIPSMTVYENIAFVLRVIDAPTKFIKKRVPYVINLVGLHDKMNSYPDELSGGEKQRVAIARALVNDPQLIIADEPTGNIDPELSYEIVELLKGINDQGTTILMVTHEHDLVRHFGGRIININNGRIVFDEILTGKNDEIPEGYEEIALEEPVEYISYSEVPEITSDLDYSAEEYTENYENEDDEFEMGSEFPTLPIAEALLNEKQAEQQQLEQAKENIPIPLDSMTADDIISAIKENVTAQTEAILNPEKDEAADNAETVSESDKVAIPAANTIKPSVTTTAEVNSLRQKLEALTAAEDEENIIGKKIEAIRSADKKKSEIKEEPESHRTAELEKIPVPEKPVVQENAEPEKESRPTENNARNDSPKAEKPKGNGNNSGQHRNNNYQHRPRYKNNNKRKNFNNNQKTSENKKGGADK